MSNQGDEPLADWLEDGTTTTVPVRQGGRRTLILTVAAVLVGGLLAAVGLYVWLGGDGQTSESSGNAAGSSASGATASATSPPLSSAKGSPTTSHESVVLAESEVDKPDAQAIVDLFTSYFNAINDKDYATFVSLLENGSEQKSQASFEDGYKTTVDSEIGIDRITPTPDGTLAQVSFTSRQDAEDAVDGASTCLVWRMEFRVVHKADHLLIAPPGMSDPEYRSC